MQERVESFIKKLRFWDKCSEVIKLNVSTIFTFYWWKMNFHWMTVLKLKILNACEGMAQDSANASSYVRR
jgi:hypothetical protein